MRRREVISTVCCLSMLSFAAHAQQPMRVIGFLDNSSSNAAFKAAFNKGLSEGGYEADLSMVFYGHPTRFAPAVEDVIIQAAHDLLPAPFDGPRKR